LAIAGFFTDLVIAVLFQVEQNYTLPLLFIQFIDRFFKVIISLLGKLSFFPVGLGAGGVVLEQFLHAFGTLIPQTHQAMVFGHHIQP